MTHHQDGAPGSDDPSLNITLLEHELDEARLENVRLRQSLLEPPYSQLRSVIRQYPKVAKTAIKALNVVTGTGRVNFHRRALARLQFPRDLREMDASGLFDAAWYQANYPDVATSGMDPLRHYALTGATRGGTRGRASRRSSTSSTTPTCRAAPTHCCITCATERRGAARSRHRRWSVNG
jgi:hypothetical protein